MNKDKVKVKYLVVNKYSRIVPGGIEMSVGLQEDSLLSDCKVITYNDTDYGRFKIGKWNFSLKSIVLAFINIRRSNTVIINIPSPILGDISFLLCKVLNKKLIMFYHAEVLNYGIVGSVYNNYLRMLVSKSDKLIISSAKYRECLGIKHDNVEYIPFAASDEFEESCKDLSSNRNFDVIFFGRISRYKNVDLIIRFARNNPQNRVLIAGPSDNTVNLLNLPDNVELRDKYFTEKEKAELFLLSKVLVLPSISKAETFGIVQVEALCAGCKVVNYDNNTGVSTVTKGLKGCYTVLNNNDEEWFAAINKSLGSAVDAKVLKEFYLTHYSRNSIKDKLHKAIVG